jgi:hypothetical protein
MKLRDVAPITIRIGEYPSTFHAYEVGPLGCGRCDCGHQPEPGDWIWCNNYADLRCDTCAQNTQEGQS